MTRGLWWLASYPKSGNTWLRICLHNLLRDSAVPLAINELDMGPLASCRSWFEDTLGVDSGELPPQDIGPLRALHYRWAAAHSSGAMYCKVHDAQSRFADGTCLFPAEVSRGALYLLRNPLDVAVSLALHMGCSIDEAITRMASPGHTISALGGNDQLPQRLSCWSGHVLSWVDGDIPVMVIRYEDLHAAPVTNFRRAASFLQLAFSEDQLRRAVRHSAFAELRRQEDKGGFREASGNTQRFFRAGHPGGWREHLNPDQAARIIRQHYEVMARFGYLDANGEP